MKTRLLRMCKIGFAQIRKPYYQGVPEELTFYLILSLVPILMLISQGLYAIFPGKWGSSIAWILEYLHKVPFGKEAGKIVLGRNGGAVSILFILVAIWSASKWQYSLIRIANYTFGIPQPRVRDFIKDRFRAVRTMLLTIIIAMFALIVLMYGDIIVNFVMSIIGKEAATAKIWLILRWPLAIVLYFTLISYMYFTLPSVKSQYRDVVPGSIFASVGILLVTYVYKIYLGKFANYNLLYGSLATIVAIMFWFYFLSWVICIGIIVNKSWMDSKSGEGNS